ncbi:uncharacterized protein LOC132121100 isoform X3 [Carassius carassius]|uniref:uncharacterized protein LOC132121100 isoform X3 n=1 Tax=Carassius carassius TaxID=217509 RepID=UPI00286947E0|nr:uncharacterized protein LOC132121100 isoform X3 [Carassius carassius]
MTGRQSGLITRLKKDYPLLESIHCLAHRLELSNRSTSLMDATREIKMTIEVLKAFKITPGKSMEKAEEALKVGEFKRVPLRSSKENVNRLQFLQAIIDSLSSRMPDTKLTKIITPLDPLSWPKSRESLILFGEKEIHDLAKMLEVPSREAVEDFRNWKLNNDQNGKVLKKLLTASKTYLASSSECERGFSVLNATATDARNRLRVRSLSAVLFIDINGPPLKMFDAYPYIQSWLREKHCLSTASKTGRRDKSAEKIRPLWVVLNNSE